MTEKETTAGSDADSGSDLLELPTAVIERAETNPAARAAQELPLGSIDWNDLNDAVRSAEILMNEGLLEEAKSILRKALRHDSHCVPARVLLEKIHDRELQQIFNSTSGGSRSGHATRLFRGFGAHAPAEEGLAARGFTALERELGMDRELAFDQKPLEFSLFQDADAMQAYAFRLDRSMRGASPRDRMDLGVGFMEMGLYDLAIRQFRAADQAIRDAENPDFELERSALCLLAQALIGANRFYEAILSLERMIMDGEISKKEKTELFYLMGRAQESLEKPEIAAQWYQQAIESQPNYRDTRERLKKLLRVGQ